MGWFNLSKTRSQENEYLSCSIQIYVQPRSGPAAIPNHETADEDNNDVQHSSFKIFFTNRCFIRNSDVVLIDDERYYSIPPGSDMVTLCTS